MIVQVIVNPALRRGAAFCTMCINQTRGHQLVLINSHESIRSCFNTAMAGVSKATKIWPYDTFV